MLHEHYGIMMTFDTLSKELYFLKQGMRENMAEFGVCLSQVQILQMKYPSRIQQEHVEEVKQDQFYDGLNPKYKWKLDDRVNGENNVTYSELLLAGWKLERWAEFKDPLHWKTSTMGGSNVTCSHYQENIFPSRKLEGNGTFTAQSAVVGAHEADED